ncbi:MAG: hypothetical protein DRR06_17105 [Gammaproteobacteria bacterium]|nr:MAG: hypothetical protein DRR06_17105 [Gammaproteobacteria bacterium]
MIYLYSKPNCPKCEARYVELDTQGVDYEVRDARRLEGGLPVDDLDAIDREAHVQLNMNNMELPVEVQVD